MSILTSDVLLTTCEKEEFSIKKQATFSVLKLGLKRKRSSNDFYNKPLKRRIVSQSFTLSDIYPNTEDMNREEFVFEKLNQYDPQATFIIKDTELAGDDFVLIEKVIEQLIQEQRNSHVRLEITEHSPFVEDNVFSIDSESLPESLTDLTLLNKNQNIEVIGDGFLWKNSLDSLTFRHFQNIQYIQDDFLSDSLNLKKVVFHSSFSEVHKIGDNFLSSIAIKNINLSSFKKVRKIGEGFLSECEYLKKVDISSLENLKFIGELAFACCPDLNEIILPCTKEEIRFRRSPVEEDADYQSDFSFSSEDDSSESQGDLKYDDLLYIAPQFAEGSFSVRIAFR